MFWSVDRTVQNQKMVADVVESVRIARVIQSGGRSVRTKLLMKDAKAYLLGHRDLTGVACEPDLQCADTPEQSSAPQCRLSGRSRQAIARGLFHHDVRHD